MTMVKIWLWVSLISVKGQMKGIYCLKYTTGSKRGVRRQKEQSLHNCKGAGDEDD